ncbi:hypothetical protein GW17_00018893 [Ensete ventricosum]|nr:hypothetical protein GW17_00018893 [Ensete ventricosum]
MRIARYWLIRLVAVQKPLVAATRVSERINLILKSYVHASVSAQGIADTMAYLQGEGHLLRGEHNLLGEAFLIMASSAG